MAVSSVGMAIVRKSQLGCDQIRLEAKETAQRNVDKQNRLGREQRYIITCRIDYLSDSPSFFESTNEVTYSCDHCSNLVNRK
jgi:hypothetical protein